MESSEPQPGIAAATDPVITSELFRSFPAEAHDELLAAFEQITLPSGSILFEQGAPGDSMYLVRSGRVGVLIVVERHEQPVIEYGPGASVGELALITGKPRTARVLTLEPSELLRLTHSRFAALAARYPKAVAHFTTLLTPRIRRSQLVEVLGGLFGQLSPEALQDIVRELEWHHLLGGATLFKEGDCGQWPLTGKRDGG
jgi:signal-transduction protein with cAMP-binding, CBS, and nucleotidyltransferase domain